MTRPLAVGAVTIVIVALAAACAAVPPALVPADEPAPEREPAAVPTPAPTKPTPKKPKPKRGPKPDSRRINALVTVVDGDTGRRLHGARVVIGPRAGYANRRGSPTSA